MDSETALQDALALHKAGELDVAAAAYEAILERTPDHAGAWLNLGAARRQQGRLPEALKALRRAAGLAPDHPGVLYNLGNALAESGELDAAARQFTAAFQAQPDFIDAYNNLGDVQARAGDDMAAAETFRKGLALAPTHPGLLNNLGNALHRLGDAEAALEHLKAALAAAPDDAEVLRNLGNVLRTMGRVKDAIEVFDRVIANNAEDAEAHCLRGFSRLALGEFAAGWDDYAWRWQSDDFEDARPFTAPYWQGEELAERTLLVWGEQAVGDELMFATMMDDLIQTGAQITLETEFRLVALMNRTFPAIRAVARRSPPDPILLANRFDFHIALGDLGAHFRARAESFAANRAYLRADAEKTTAFESDYQARASRRRRIGISWRSGAEQAGQSRSIPLDVLSPVLGRDDCWFVNLQYGDTASELAAAGCGRIFDIFDDPGVDQMTDLDAFAAQIASLDLVISAANTTVHMAGALGVPTLALMAQSPDWRWGRDGEICPWYPAVRLLRQAAPDEWRPVVQSVIEYLDESTPD